MCSLVKNGKCLSSWKSSYGLKFLINPFSDFPIKNMLCPRGQQIRVFGGFHKNALDNGYMVWRPHFHPILDESIVEDPNLWSSESEKAENKFEKRSDIESLSEYFAKYLHIDKPSLSLISVDEKGFTIENNIDVENIDENPRGFIPVPDSDNIKIFGKDINSFNELKQEDMKNSKMEIDDESINFKSFNGKTVDEIIHQSRMRPKRKYGQSQNGGPLKLIITQSGKKAKNDKNEESEKGFSGGFVMTPSPGFYENTPILDFNSLYPNIMISFFLDCYTLVLEKRFAMCPGVIYLKIRLNATKEFLFAQGIQGVMTKHTQNLVNSKKFKFHQSFYLTTKKAEK